MSNIHDLGILHTKTGATRLNDRVKFLRQSVRISGINTASFNQAIQSIKDIIAIYSRTVSKIQPPSFVSDDEHGAYLDVSNRYFSSTRDTRGGLAIPFAKEVDPSGTLGSLVGSKYYHGEENSVMYLERRFNGTSGKK